MQLFQNDNSRFSCRVITFDCVVEVVVVLCLIICYVIVLVTCGGGGSCSSSSSRRLYVIVVDGSEVLMFQTETGVEWYCDYMLDVLEHETQPSVH